MPLPVRMLPISAFQRRCFLALSLVSCVVDANLDAKAWANITSLSEKEVFLQALVKELHGSVVSDAGLKSYALVAPSDYNLLLSQLKTQLWLCGGDTGRPCDAPVANWQNVVAGKDPQKTAAFAQNLLRGMEVSDEQAFLAWARSPPEDLNAALDQLKGASFVCGGSRPCHHSFAAGDPTELTPQQSRAVWTGTIAFICLCLLVVVIVVIAYAIVQEDKQRCTSHDLQMQVRNSRLKYQHSLAQKELASSAAQEHKLPLVPAVSYVTGPPPMVSGYADVRQMVIPRAASPVYSGRPQAVPYTVSAPPAYSATG